MPESDKKEIIVIVGFGWVGQANALALVRMGYEVFYYDVIAPPRHYEKQYSALYDRVRPIAAPLEKDSLTTWYLVCIGDRVSEDGEQDISLIERALIMLAPTRGKVILRSTVLPRYLSNLRFDLYVPEFLHEIKAVEECVAPYYFVIGSRLEQALPSFLREWEERAYRVFKGTPEAAAHVKYLSNIWNALRIGFVNEFGDSIAAPESEVKRQEIERVLDFILERKSYLRYGQGFGGHCLPKDLRAYVKLKSDEGRAVPILRGLYESNTRHEETAQKYQTLPQWFSFWDYHGGRSRPGAVIARWWRAINSAKPVRHARRALQPARRFIERVFPTKTLPEIKQAWNERAARNVFYYTNPDSMSGRKADEFEVCESGHEDYASYIAEDPHLSFLFVNPGMRTVLEIGSGVGRITEHLAKHFGAVYGIDISPAMLEVARKRLAAFSNIVLLENSGTDVPVPDSQVDFIFSHLTFRHLPSREHVAEYFREIRRVLKDGGMVKAQLRTGPEVYRWRWFHGVSVSPDEARALAEQAGLTIVDIEKENAKSLWVTAKKL